MSKKARRKFSDDKKKEILDAYINGTKTVSELAHENNISTGLIYQWKSDRNLKDKNNRVDELSEAGLSRAMAIKIQQQEVEMEAYQKKVAEQAVIIDLLKKRRGLGTCLSESELSGLIATIKRLDRKRGPAK